MATVCHIGSDPIIRVVMMCFYAKGRVSLTSYGVPRHFTSVRLSTPLQSFNELIVHPVPLFKGWLLLSRPLITNSWQRMCDSNARSFYTLQVSNLLQSASLPIRCKSLTSETLGPSLPTNGMFVLVVFVGMVTLLLGAIQRGEFLSCVVVFHVSSFLSMNSVRFNAMRERGLTFGPLSPLPVNA